ILVFLAPMVTTLLAALFLGEPLEWKQSLAILTGFAGVLVAVNPFGLSHTGDWIGYLACLVCVTAFSTSMVWSRVLTQTETPLSLTFFSGLMMTGAGTIGLVWRANLPDARLLLVLLCTAVFSIVGSTCFFLALKSTTAASVSQFHYSQLVTGALIAFVFWHEKLTLFMVAGATLIIGAGLYTALASYGKGAGSHSPGMPTGEE
ncbi:MAG TPA: DMT family transporter, partial [Acidobacteriaceae bacterium]|nr:DMT family transporter [Acidobacteriaceae bacterium]